MIVQIEIMMIAQIEIMRARKNLHSLCSMPTMSI